MTYAERQGSTHLDGTRIFQNGDDRAAEAEVAREIEARWHCKLTPFGALSPVDWFATRLERLVGVLELKSRTHEHTRFPSVFLNVRKWLALSLASAGLGVPALFVVRFVDVTLWVSLVDIDARKVRIAGCAHRVKADNDIEPVIDVEVDLMKRLQ